MRLRDNYDYYYFSTEPVSDEEERSEIINQQRLYAKEIMLDSLRPSDDPVENIKKYFPIGVFFLAVILMFVFSFMKMVAPIVYTFGGVFVFFGIMAAIPGNKNKPLYDDVPQNAKLPKWIVSPMVILIGLAIIIPELIVSEIGHAGALVTMAGLGFGFAGILMIAITISGFIKLRSYSEEVNASCIGYLKSTSSSRDDTGGMIFIIGTPVFEYYYNGQTYKAFQVDDFRGGRLKPERGGTVQIKVNPDDPEDIMFSKSIAGKVLVIFLALLSLGASVFLFSRLTSVSDEGYHVTTLGGKVGDTRAEFNDDTIAKHLSTDNYTIRYVTVESKYREDDQWLLDLSDGTTIGITDDVAYRYEEGTSFYNIKPADGSAGINFMADEYRYTGSREVIGAPS